MLPKCESESGASESEIVKVKVEGGEEMTRPALVCCMGLVVLEEVGWAKSGWEGG